MAVLTRRTWATILTETILRVGNITSTGFDGRLKYWLASAYFDICTSYHHVELDDIDTSLTCSTSTNEVTLPNDLFVLVGVRLLAVGSASIIGPLVIEDYRLSADRYTLTSGAPEKCARYGNKIYFDRKPDQAYPLEVYHYRRGLAPDFDTPTSPELDSDVDEHIIEFALAKAFTAIGRPDLGSTYRDAFATWAGSQIRFTAMGLPSAPERERTGTTYTGNQG